MPYSTVSIPSSFPTTSRPVYLYPTATMSKKEILSAVPAILRAMDTIVSHYHPDDRILIHSVSYDLGRTIHDHLARRTDRPVTTYSDSNSKHGGIQQYLSRRGSILIAPSLDRGVDFPYDQCRAIIIPKVPFPNLADKQVSARLHSPGGQIWYNVKTIRTLIQMTGRGMRSEDDHCASYILDKQFIDIIWRKCQYLIPEWWKASLVLDCGVLRHDK